MTIHNAMKGAGASRAEGDLRPPRLDQRTPEMGAGQTEIGLLLTVESRVAPTRVLEGDRLHLVLALIFVAEMTEDVGAGVAVGAGHGVQVGAVAGVPVVVTTIATDAKADETTIIPRKMALVVNLKMAIRNVVRA